MIVQLPLARSAPATAEVLAIAPGSKRRVLLVDDRRDAILPVQRMLEHTGHEVASACDGPSGLDTLRTFRPDTVLCDIGLAGTMNGYDFAQAVRSLPGFDRLYLVAVTGYGREEDRRAAQDAGFDHHVTKPISQDQLERILANTPRFR